MAKLESWPYVPGLVSDRRSEWTDSNAFPLQSSQVRLLLSTVVGEAYFHIDRRSQ